MLDKEAMIRDAIMRSAASPSPGRTYQMEDEKGKYNSPGTICEGFTPTAVQALANYVMTFLGQRDLLALPFSTVGVLRAKNAWHKKKKHHVRDLDAQQIADAILDEAKELADDPHDIEEAADIIVAVYQLCHLKGWTLQELHTAALRKIDRRFEEHSPEEKAALEAAQKAKDADESETDG